MIELHNQSKRRTIQGFSLIEMLISIVIFTIIMGMVYAYLMRSKDSLFGTQEELAAANAAQDALRSLREDILQVGAGRDSENDQPRILRAGPYEFVFVADLDRDKTNELDRYGSPINPLPPLSEFDPIRQLVEPPPSNDWGWDRNIAYGDDNFGAEIVRYSLDFNSDMAINEMDTENMIASTETGMTHNLNPCDFFLFKEYYGVKNLASGVANSYSGRQIIATNIRGNIYIPGSPVDRSSFLYPNANKSYPDPLFMYWGHFLNNFHPNDDPETGDWPGEQLDLWGDWGGGPPPDPVSPYTPSGDVGDGVLSDSEIRYLLDNPQFSTVRVLAPEGPNDDFNGNRIAGEVRIDQIIRQIGLNITTEVGSPTRQYNNLVRSNATPPAAFYRFRDFTLATTLTPPNLELEGAPILVRTPVTVTPAPSTPTMGPTETPTTTPNTPVPTGSATTSPTADTPTGTATVGPGTPSNTPLATDTPTPVLTETPTPTPDGNVFNRDELVVGSRNALIAFSLDHTQINLTDLCDNALRFPYFLNLDPIANVVDMASANLCDPADMPDRWNDLIYAIDSPPAVNPNLYYMNHLPFTSIDGLVPVSSARVGSINSTISTIATGDINYDGENTNTLYPEIFVSTYDSVNKQSTISILSVLTQCGNILDLGYFRYTSPINIKIVDLEIADFDGDGYSDLAAITNSTGSNPQLIVFNQLYNALHSPWRIFYQTGPSMLFTGTEYPVKIASGHFLSEVSVPPDIIVISNLGNIKIIANSSSGFSDTICNPPLSIPSSVRYGLTAYSVTADTHDRFAAMSNHPSQHVSNFATTGTDCSSIDALSSCSGIIFPLTSPTPLAYSQSIDSFNVQRNGTEYAIINLAFMIQQGSVFAYRLALIPDPCTGITSFPDDICFLQIGFPVNCLTSTKNTMTGIPPVLPTPYINRGSGSSVGFDVVKGVASGNTTD